MDTKFTQSFCQNGVQCQKLQHVFKVQSLGLDTGTQLFCHLFTDLLTTHCLKLAQKSTVQVCRVAIVVMETTQLVLSQLKKFFTRVK